MRLFRRLALSGAGLAVGMAVAGGMVAWHQGYRIYVIHTGSMVPTLRSGDAVLDRPSHNAVSPGEIVTFTVRSGPDSVVTHRVASVSGGAIHTKGDANRTVDPWTIQRPQVVGSAQATLPLMGYALVYLQHPQGFASVLTVILGLILLWQLFFPAPPGDPLGHGSDNTTETAGNRHAASARHARHGRRSPSTSWARRTLRLPYRTSVRTHSASRAIPLACREVAGVEPKRR